MVSEAVLNALRMSEINKNNVLLEKRFHIEGGDFIRAGEVSSTIKKILKEMGLPVQIIRRTSIAAYEAEMNVVCYAYKGDFHFYLTPKRLYMIAEDEGPGIEDIELALKEGYSTASEEIREMGFGAGMGLPNIKKNVDKLKIDSEIGKGTRLEMVINLVSTDEDSK